MARWDRRRLGRRDDSQSARPDRGGRGRRLRQGGATYPTGGLSRGSVSSFSASNSVRVRPSQSPPNCGANVTYLTCVDALLPSISRATPRILVRILPRIQALPSRRACAPLAEPLRNLPRLFHICPPRPPEPPAP